MGVSIRAYARGRGCTEGAVRKAIAAKRITPNPDGTIDPQRANQEWERNTFAGKTLHQATRPQVVSLSAPPHRVAVRACRVSPKYRAILFLPICGPAQSAKR